MSENQVYIVDELRQKIKSLADRLNEHKKTNSVLTSENSGLELKLKEKEKEISDLKQKNNTLQLTRAFSSEDEEPQEAKLQINKIVREIDKCIALLNR